jgi:hypothetical protein
MHVEKQAEEAVQQSSESPQSGRLTAILGGLGVLSLAGAVCAATAAHWNPQVAWIAEQLERGGTTSGDLFLGGSLAFGLAVVGGSLGRMLRRTESLEDAVETLDKMESGLVSLRTRISRLHLEITGLQESHKTLLKLSHDQSSAQAAGMQIDAIFRLAASLDQLGGRLEGRMAHQDQQLAEHLESLSGALQETREQLDQVMHRSDHFEPPSRRTYPTEEARLPEPLEEQELEVVVSLEDVDDGFDDFDDELEGPRIDPSQFDWGAPPDPEDRREPTETAGAASDSGLGLLDTLDDSGSVIDEEPRSLIPDVEADAFDAANEPHPGDSEDSVLRLLSDDVLQAALENVRRRPID